MKRLWIFLLALLLPVSLLGCGGKETKYTVTKNGTEFHVDNVQKTISDGKNIYRYAFSGDSSRFTVTITYPDGSTYWYNQSGSMGNGGWSEDYEEGLFVPGDTLVEVVREKAPVNANPGKLVSALMLLALGFFDLLAPKLAWYLGYGWWYQNAEPSDAALVFARVAGGVAVVAGIVLLLV